MNRTESMTTYVDRLINDEELRGTLGKTAKAGGSAARRIRKKGPRKAAEDAKVRRQAMKAVVSAAEAVKALEQPKKKHKARWLKRLLFLGLVGCGIYLAINEPARNRLMEALGSESGEPG